MCSGQESCDALHSSFESNHTFFIVIKVVSSTHFIFIQQLLRHSVQDWMVLERFERCSANFANVGMFKIVLCVFLVAQHKYF